MMNYLRRKAFHMRVVTTAKPSRRWPCWRQHRQVIGGSQRERLDVLDARMTGAASTRHCAWYRDLRRYGTVPHAGFGLFERTLARTASTSLANVRDTPSRYPRQGNARY